MVASKKFGAQGGKVKRRAAGTSAPDQPRGVPQAGTSAMIDRRDNGDRRSKTDRRVENVPVAVERRTLQRRAKVNRRRQIDPTTCERDYTPDEIEFMGALDEYKRRNGRMFPTCSEVLEVVRSLGYEKRPKTIDAALPLVDLSGLPVAVSENPTPVG